MPADGIRHRLERPLHQQLLQSGVQVRMPDQRAAAICFQNRLDDRRLVGCVFVVFGVLDLPLYGGRPDSFEKFPVIAGEGRTHNAADFLQRPRER